MKEYFNINALADAYNAMVSGWVILLTTVFGQYYYLFGAFLFFNVVDWLTGWYKARKLKQESSAIGLQGLVKKMLYWVLIAVAFVTAAVFTALGNDILQIDLSFLNLLGWFCLASLMVNEARSIVENFVEMGYNVPTFLTKGLQVAADLIDSKADVPEKIVNKE
nr:MAG TPA: holin [Caudoviricetes sp.]